MTTNYSTPKLCDRGGDLSKQWYVYLYYTSFEGIKKQFRYSDGLNVLKTKRERKIEASALIEALIYQLKSGWSPFTNTMEAVDDKQLKTVSAAFDEIFEIKKAYLTRESIRTYKNQIDLFKSWLVKKKLDHLYTQNFTADHIRKYCDWMLRDRKYCGKTYNGHLTMLRTFFTEMVNRKYMPVSPVAGLKFVRQEVGKNTTYSEADEKRFEEIRYKDPEFYLATRFVRYCFLRRTELAKLQVKHINWTNRTIIIPSKNAKSRVQDSVTIPGTLEKLIKQSGLLQLDPETYIFGRHFKPAAKAINDLDDFSDRQRAVNKSLGIGAGRTFYSWKHTGAVELYNLTKDPYVVMRQCRHTDIKMTMIYLRSLGCGVNEQVRAW